MKYLFDKLFSEVYYILIEYKNPNDGKKYGRWKLIKINKFSEDNIISSVNSLLEELQKEGNSNLYLEKIIKI